MSDGTWLWNCVCCFIYVFWVSEF